jgi:hypothetical protein
MIIREFLRRLMFRLFILFLLLPFTLMLVVACCVMGSATSAAGWRLVWCDMCQLWNDSLLALMKGEP